MRSVAITVSAPVPRPVGQSNLALCAYKSAYRLYDKTDAKLNVGVVAFRIGHLQTRLFHLRGDPSMLRDALGYLEQAEGVYRAARQDAERGDALTLLAHVKERLGQPEAKVDPSPPRAQPDLWPYKLMQGLWTRASRLMQRLWAKLLEPKQLENGLSQAQFDWAMGQIQVDQFRKMFLRSWLDRHAPADLERAEFLYNRVILPLETQAKAMHLGAKERGDAKLLNQAELRASDALAYGKFLITRDREASTHATAVALLRAHLDRGDRYVLFLRNFELEISRGIIPKEHGQMWQSEDYGADLIHVNWTIVRRCFPKEKFEESLTRSCRIVEVSDIDDALDWRRSEGVSKLRVKSVEWELVVSMLIGEAAAVVVFAQQLTDGLTKELELIKRLESADKTTILIIEPDDREGIVRSQSDINTKRLGFELLREALAMRFGGRLAGVQQLTESNIEEVIERIRSQLAGLERHGASAGLHD